MKKLLLILLIVTFALPAHADETIHDKDMLLMEYMALNTIWAHYACDKPLADMDDPVQRKQTEQWAENFANWLKVTYGKNWRLYINYYLEMFEMNNKAMLRQNAIDLQAGHSISLEDTLFCKRFLELDAKASEMFKK